jgi:hypothetical protein
MSADAMAGFLRDSAFSFVGTVDHVQAATMENLPIDERTVVVHVDQVLHSPEAFAQLAGNTATLQLAEGSDAVEEGSRWVFFANGLAYAETIALSEVGRANVDDVESTLTMGAGAGAENPLHAMQAQVEAERLRAHASDADAVILGRVIGLERAAGSPIQEHAEDWWRATFSVVHVERGDVSGDQVKAIYANSLDVRWRDAPKPKASQNGLWLLHATEGPLAELAPWQIVHAEDFQPVHALDSLRENGGDGQ